MGQVERGLLCLGQGVGSRVKVTDGLGKAGGSGGRMVSGGGAGVVV